MMKVLTFRDFYTNLSPSIRATIFITIVLVIAMFIINRKLKNPK